MIIYNFGGCFVAGADTEGPWFLSDILVNIRKSGEDSTLGVIKEVFQVSFLLTLRYTSPFIVVRLRIVISCFLNI